MPRNFNTAPTQTPELGKSDWDYGDPISSGVPTGAGGSEWNLPRTPDTPSWDNNDDWGTPTSVGSSSFDSWDSYQPLPQTSQESGVAERLRELKDKVIHGMGRKALDAVMNRLPRLGGQKEAIQNITTNLYENPDMASAVYQNGTDLWNNRSGYAEQAVGYAKQAGREVAGAGISAAKESVMKYYGLEKDENEKLRIARKIKFGKAVVKTVVNPIGTASSVGTRAGYAARKAGVSSAKGHLASQAEAARNWQPKPVAATPDAWSTDW